MSRESDAELRATLGHRRLLLAAAALLVAGFLLLPLAAIVPASVSAGEFLVFPPRGLSLRWYHEVLTSADWRGPLLGSLRTSVVAAVAATLLGSAAALGLQRLRRTARMTRSLFIVPLVVPYIVYALGLFTLLSGTGLLDSLAAVALGQTTLALPLVVIAVSAALAGLDPALPRAARSLGAGWVRVAWQVELPLVRRSLAGAFVFALVFCFDEVVVAVFLSPPGVQTLPGHLFSEATGTLTPAAAAAGMLVVGVALAGLAVFGLLLGRGREVR